MPKIELILFKFVLHELQSLKFSNQYHCCRQLFDSHPVLKFQA